MLQRFLVSAFVLGSFIVLWSGISPQSARAEDEAPPPKEDTADSTSVKDEYDFSWLDPDKKIYVVQNRKYTKAKGVELALNGGIGFGEPYRSTRVLMPRLSYYFSESWGISAVGLLANLSENGNFKALKDASSVIPSVRDTVAWGGASLLWIPFYAKINVFNRILYVDWQFELGAANVNSEIDLNTSSSGNPNVVKASYVGAFWGTGQKFYFSRNWAMRFDFEGLYYSAPIAKSGAISTVKETKDNYYFTLGASYTF